MLITHLSTHNDLKETLSRIRLGSRAGERTVVLRGFLFLCFRMELLYVLWVLWWMDRNF